MLNFACDYLDAAHPKVFEALMKNNFVKTGCYDESESDCFCNAARTSTHTPYSTKKATTVNM